MGTSFIEVGEELIKTALNSGMSYLVTLETIGDPVEEAIEQGQPTVTYPAALIRFIDTEYERLGEETYRKIMNYEITVLDDNATSSEARRHGVDSQSAVGVYQMSQDVEDAIDGLQTDALDGPLEITGLVNLGDIGGENDTIAAMQMTAAIIIRTEIV
jgi:hypothetical protein